jgi:hypothetical protein
MFIPVLGPIQLLIQWVPRLFPGVKQPRCEINLVKHKWSHTYSPPVCLYGVDRVNFTFSKR